VEVFDPVDVATQKFDWITSGIGMVSRVQAKVDINFLEQPLDLILGFDMGFAMGMEIDRQAMLIAGIIADLSDTIGEHFPAGIIQLLRTGQFACPEVGVRVVHQDDGFCVWKCRQELGHLVHSRQDHLLDVGLRGQIAHDRGRNQFQVTRF